MSRRLRAFLLILGLLLLAISLAALLYAFQDGEVLRGSATLAPTLFTLPAGGAP
jgi:hypothetical protein